MNIRHALLIAASIVLVLSGCTTPNDQAQVERLMRHRAWPQIEQIARAEVTKREKLLGWPDTAVYLPAEHEDQVWVVMAMVETPVHRTVTLMIGDEGAVLAYKRNGEGER